LVVVMVGILADNYDFDSVEGRVARPGRRRLVSAGYQNGF
jgi:hypothetical protein